mgnify:CR=1 FL=1
MRNLVSKTFKIQIKGRVQGVGFRPFVFNLAKEHQLNGSVSNNEEGVIIYCNTSEEKATQFLEQILLNKPEIAVITAHSTDEVPLIKFDDFSIVNFFITSQQKVSYLEFIDSQLIVPIVNKDNPDIFSFDFKLIN